MPDIHGTEMGARRIFVSNAVNNGYVAILVHFLYWSHGWVKTDLVVKV
jgi:hypothetical protein